MMHYALHFLGSPQIIKSRRKPYKLNTVAKCCKEATEKSSTDTNKLFVMSLNRSNRKQA